MTRQTVFALSASLLLPFSLFASEIPRTDAAFAIDGRLDEAAWQDAARFELDIETRPGENVPAKVRTVAYLIEDGDSLFIAFDASDPQPDAIRAYLRDRDSAFNDDFVGIVIDTYGDAQRAFEFFANPLGVQMDLTNDDVNQNEDESWDAIWDSAGVIGDAGFVVEMEIPLNQLRFPSVAGMQSWGIDLLRFYPREHRYRLSNNAQDRNLNCYLCQLGTVQGFENVKSGRDLEIVPTLTASQLSSSENPGFDALQSEDAEVEVGLNVRWGITPDTTVNLAINPDFSQVESDTAQLDVNNQFALYYPEKRPFFLEGADYFSTPIQAVFTRTVADPSAGAKLTSKKGRNTFAMFAARDEITNLIFPGAFSSDSETLLADNSAFVGRYSRSFGEASNVGALVTARSGNDYHNYVGGLDMRWKVSDQHSVQLQYLGSSTEYPDQVAIDFDQPLGRFSGDAAEATYDFSSRNWFAYARYISRDRLFRADSGFVPRVDYRQQVLGVGRVWHGDEGNWYSRLRLNGDWDIAHDDSGRLLERETEAYFSIQGALQSFVEIGVLQRDRLYDDVMFDESSVSLYGEMKPIGGLVLGAWMRVGQQIDFDNTRLGDEFRIEPFLHWNINRHLLLRYEGTYANLDTEEGPNIFKATVHDLRLTWQFSTRSFLRLTTQLQDIKKNPAEYIDPVDAHTRDVGRQLLYSYKLNPQTVFFLGYSDALVDDDILGGLEASDRTWFLKIGYAWSP